jgi:hypothetical protein
MSCCGRQAGERAQVPQRRQAREAAPAMAATTAVPAMPPGGVPLQLRYMGTRALALPVGARRLLVQPGQVLRDLPAAERAALRRTGLFR